MESTRDVVRQFITTNFYVADPAQLSDDASLLDCGIIDSTGVLEIVAFLEERFGIRLEDREIVPENLDSIARLEAFIARSSAPATGAHV
jgi:acyl carrier protein